MKAGDTLSGIAKRELGRSGRWTEIYRIPQNRTTIGGDPEAAVASYERGDLDLVVVPSTSARRVIDDPNLKPEVVDTPQLTIAYYDFATCQNPKKCPPSTTTANGKTPLQNKNFRIAMSRAIDKKELIDVAYAGLGVPAASTVMPGIPGWPDDYDPYPYDVAKANEAMATADQRPQTEERDHQHGEQNEDEPQRELSEHDDCERQR